MHVDLAFLRTDRHILVAKPANHIERVFRFAAQRQFQQIILNPMRQSIPQFMLNFEKTVCRAQPANPLMRTLAVVIFDP